MLFDTRDVKILVWKCCESCEIRRTVTADAYSLKFIQVKHIAPCQQDLYTSSLTWLDANMQTMFHEEVHCKRSKFVQISSACLWSELCFISRFICCVTPKFWSNFSRLSASIVRGSAYTYSGPCVFHFLGLKMWSEYRGGRNKTRWS